MKRVRYGPRAAAELVKYASMAKRIRRALEEYASETGARRNQVVALKGSGELRLRVGDFRVVFVEDAESIEVTRIGPRGSVYGD